MLVMRRGNERDLTTRRICSGNKDTPVLSTDSLPWFEMMRDGEKTGKERGGGTC